MIKCRVCNTLKTLDEYYKLNNGGTRTSCKTCDREQTRIWTAANKERKKIKAQAEYKRNKSEYAARKAKYRACKLQASPPWLTPQQLHNISNLYRLCGKINDQTGKPHHVDHVVPLQGKNICGLHVPWNLAIIPASMNLAKSNKYTG